jgi:hypothetical protein
LKQFNSQGSFHVITKTHLKWITGQILQNSPHKTNASMVRKYGNSLGQKSPEKRTTATTHQCQFMQANEVAKETTKMAQQSDQLCCPTTNFQAYH